ncbi:asparaginase [Heyndrickxia oleronia]|uniref:asparaginase n=1 Tax=Heyndrickxia oleronia TaxID=38875 RepID=UPI00203C8171|nr:asparaginase [Heyndrickxia oleronia]MCM3238578.1 asparaginase [Heyndrickxia oleronia]
MGYDILIEETRAGLVENKHFGVICGINEMKKQIYQVGDSHQEVFFRSAAKPIQALPLFLTNIIEKYNITEEEAALFSASHRGESYHINALESLLNKLPVVEEDLFCPPSYPLNIEPREKMIGEGKAKRRLYHNCSGKHIGFVAVCRELGYPVANYWEQDHPLQQHIVQILSTLSEVPISEIKVGIDGCGVPVFAIPLHSMALTYLKFACPDLIDDTGLKDAVVKLTRTMNHQYNMIASEHFICSILLQDPNIVAKGGAQGVYGFGLKNERIGFALKVINGSEEVWPNIVASILEQIDYKNKETIHKLRMLKPSSVKNDSGIEVGTIKETFTL